MNSDDESGKEKPFLCTFSMCRASFSKNSKLAIHIRRHKGERPFACDVPDCKKTYTNSSHLLRHKRLFHEKNKETIECPHENCSRVLSSKWNLKKHISRAHNTDRKYPFQCSQCDRGFLRKIFLKQHMSEHTGEAPYKCKKCKGKFLTKAQRNRHQRTHTTYYCDCSEEFERWSGLLQHKKACKECVLECTVCHKKFKNRQNLKHHLAVHEQPENRLVYACSYEDCDRFYFYKNNLQQHVTWYHKKEMKKFVCPEPDCRKEFCRKTNLNAHLSKMHNPNGKEKKPRRPRKDKGIPKKSAISQLLGLNLPKEEEKLLMENSGKRQLSPSTAKSLLECLTSGKSLESSELQEKELVNGIIDRELSKEDSVTKSKDFNSVVFSDASNSCAREVEAFSESDISDGELMRRCESVLNLVK